MAAHPSRILWHDTEPCASAAPDGAAGALINDMLPDYRQGKEDYMSMGYSSDIGLDLFTAPFQRPQKGAAASRRETEIPPARPQGAPSSADAHPEPPMKERALDMSDCSIPEEKTLDVSEEARRKAREEAGRRAEWETERLAKKQSEAEALQKLQGMSDAEIVSASKERIRTDMERITRRNMKECVSDHVQSVCQRDPAFARRTMHPKKTMARCFMFINRMAKDFIKKEMEENGVKPAAGVYGSDVPDGLVYRWAEEYFNAPDVLEDKEEEESVSHPYASAAKKTTESRKNMKTGKKEAGKQKKPENVYQQLTLPGVY